MCILFMGMAVIAQDAPNVSGRVWMLDGIATIPESAALKTQIGRTHPIGGFFLECRADGTFTLLRGDEAQQAGKWILAGRTLTLQRQDEKGVVAEKPIVYQVEEVADTRLVLNVVLPEGMPVVRLELSPASWPRR